MPRRPEEPRQRRLVVLLSLLKPSEDASQLARRLKHKPKTDTQGLMFEYQLLAIDIIFAHSKVMWIVVHRLATKLASEEDD